MLKRWLQCCARQIKKGQDMHVKVDISLKLPRVANIDIIAEDPDSAFELGQIFQRLDGYEATCIDGHGIRIVVNKEKAAQHSN